MTQRAETPDRPSIRLFEPTTEIKPFAVFVHVFYPEVWKRIIDRIEKVAEYPFHLIVTAPPEIVGSLPLPASRLLVSSRVIPCDNRGRDVRPFCEALRNSIDFDVGLKLHTKRSLHRLDGGDWGQTLVEALLPGEGRVRQIHRAMTRDPRLVLVAPDGMLVSQAAWMQGNKPSMQKLAQRLSLDLDQSLKRTPVFTAGTMFWFRKKGLNLLSETPLDDLFEEEAGQVDATAAHALERWIAPIAERSGGVATTVTGVLAVKPNISDAKLRRAARLLADQPNPFLVQPGRLGRLIAASPMLRNAYMRLPTGWRRQLKRWLLPRQEASVDPKFKA